MTGYRAVLPVRIICGVDPLADVIELARVRGALLGDVRAHAPWGLALPAANGASFHAVTSGTAWLEVDGQSPRQLMPGDLLLFPTGVAHRILSTPDSPCRLWGTELKRQLIRDTGEIVLDGPGAATTLICAGFSYDSDVADTLVGLLPPVLHVPAEPAGSTVGALLAVLAGEVGSRAPGVDAAVARLIDLLFIATVRAWVAGTGAGPQSTATVGGASWLRALRDPTVARALALLHERPGDPWTVAELAREVHVSRATLARRFSELVGEPPLAYLTRWRMHLAARRLRDGVEPIDAIAGSVGYSSEFAFNRAFRRARGVPPGRYRRELTAA